jgi:hypothetical protein
MDHETLAWFALLGFAAQLVDGAIGMAYGTVTNVVLLASGYPPAIASASVNAAKVATNGASALSHGWFGNIDRRLLFGMALPAVLGAVGGGLLLVHLPVTVIGPAVSFALVALGALIVLRAWRNYQPTTARRHPLTTAFVAGTLNSATGSFGPFATSALLARGVEARYAVGTISALEFVVALASVAALAEVLDQADRAVIAALVLGGLPAAPVAAWLVRHAPARVMMGVVGCVVIALSGWNLYRGFAAV